jgi:hypothetical protein
MIRAYVFSNRLGVSFVLLALILAVYLPVRTHGFVDYDDNQYVVENPHVAGGRTWDNLTWAFTTGYAANWHPLTWLSHMTDVRLYGMQPGPQHHKDVRRSCVKAK